MVAPRAQRRELAGLRSGWSGSGAHCRLAVSSRIVVVRTTRKSQTVHARSRSKMFDHRLGKCSFRHQRLQFRMRHRLSFDYSLVLSKTADSAETAKMAAPTSLLTAVRHLAGVLIPSIFGVVKILVILPPRPGRAARINRKPNARSRRRRHGSLFPIRLLA